MFVKKDNRQFGIVPLIIAGASLASTALSVFGKKGGGVSPEEQAQTQWLYGNVDYGSQGGSLLKGLGVSDDVVKKISILHKITIGQAYNRLIAGDPLGAAMLKNTFEKLKLDPKLLTPILGVVAEVPLGQTMAVALPSSQSQIPVSTPDQLVSTPIQQGLNATQPSLLNSLTQSQIAGFPVLGIVLIAGIGLYMLTRKEGGE